MSQGTIDVGERRAADPRYRPRARWPLVSKDDLMPLLALFGAIYGWVLVVAAAAVALVVVLVD